MVSEVDDYLGHLWRLRALPAQGPAVSCLSCGCRRESADSQRKCVDVMASQRGGRPMESEYHPLRG